MALLQAIDQAIGQNSFQHAKVNLWTSNVVVRRPRSARGLCIILHARAHISSPESGGRVGVVPTPPRGPLAHGARRRMLTSSRLPCFLSLAQEGCLKRLASLSKPFKYVGEFTSLPNTRSL